MLVYWVLYAIPALITVGRIRVNWLGWSLLGGMLACVIGLRFQVGADWSNYVQIYYEPSARIGLLQALTASDPGFVTLNWIATHLGMGIWLVNLFTGIVFSTGLVRFARRLPEPLLAFTAAIPYVGVVVAMNYTRQAIAIGFVLWALPYLYERRIVAYLVTIIVAAIFHKSAIIFLPLIVIVAERHRILMIGVAAVAGVAAYFALLADQITALVGQYTESATAQASQGGTLRVAMDFLPAVVLLTANHRLTMNTVERKVWLAIAVACVASMGLVLKLPTAVDRVALYFTPIQFLVASYIPQLATVDSRPLVRFLVVGLYACVLYVWLNYAGNNYAWLPYQFWPFFRATAF